MYVLLSHSYTSEIKYILLFGIRHKAKTMASQASSLL